MDGKREKALNQGLHDVSVHIRLDLQVFQRHFSTRGTFSRSRSWRRDAETPADRRTRGPVNEGHFKRSIGFLLTEKHLHPETSVWA